MNKTIAVCGKGGTGKTTFAALLIRWLLEKRKGESILAVDGDPNANLDEALGTKSENSIVSFVDDIAKNPSQIPQGMTRDRFLDYRIQESLAEADGFDLLTMGRPEGPGCYCAANNLLRSLIDKLSRSYSYVVIDNEAGMEHLSRRTTRIIDLLFIVSDYSLVGLRSAKRILDLTGELELTIKKARLVINRVPQKASLPKEKIEALGVPLAGLLPIDEGLSELSFKSGNIRLLSENSKTVSAVNRICEELI